MQSLLNLYIFDVIGNYVNVNIKATAFFSLRMLM